MVGAVVGGVEVKVPPFELECGRAGAAMGDEAEAFDEPSRRRSTGSGSKWVDAPSQGALHLRCGERISGGEPGGADAA